MAPKTGARAPEFNLPGTPGGEISLKDALAGAEYVIVAFYPKDNTSG